MGKPHLDLLALPAGLLEGLRIGQGADAFTDLFIDIARHFAHNCGGALRLKGAARAVVLVSSVVNDAALVDIAGAGEFRAARADVDVALVIEDKIRSTERSIGPCRLVPHWNVRANAVIYQPFEQSYRAVSSVAREPLRLKIKTPFNTLDHSLGDGNLRHSVSACALGIDDDPSFIVDEVIGVVSKQRVSTLPGDPCRLRIGERDLLRRLSSAAGTAIIFASAVALFLSASVIESSKVLLSNGTGCLLGFRPGNRLIARHPLVLVHVRLDQARIN